MNDRIHKTGIANVSEAVESRPSSSVGRGRSPPSKTRRLVIVLLVAAGAGAAGLGRLLLAGDGLVLEEAAVEGLAGGGRHSGRGGRRGAAAGVRRARRPHRVLRRRRGQARVQRRPARLARRPRVRRAPRLEPGRGRRCRGGGRRRRVEA